MTRERDTASVDPSRWLPRSLTRQLVLSVLAVVSVVLVTVGVFSLLNLRGYVTAMSDGDVDVSLDALSNSYTRYHNSEQPSTQHPTAPIAQAMLDFKDQAPGNVIAVLHDGVVVGSAVFSDAEARPAPPDVVHALEAQSWPDAPPRTEQLASLGSYRIDSRVAGSDLLVAGVSLARANHVIASKYITTTTLLAVAALVTAGLTVSVVGYTLRPLRRLAAIAADVAAMPLTDDDHRIDVRVRPQDADAENEVGIVGHTLNRLLDNVDSALAHRADSDLRMRQFITNASHELRTPLAAIQGYAELTRQDSSALPPTTEYALARIESEAQRMTSLVDELLLLSRLGEGEDLQTDDVDLAEVVSNAVNDATVAASTHHWVKDLPDEPVWVCGDHARLHQLVSNLLNNARVHTPPGVTVTTGITYHRGGPEGRFAELTVADDGPGIDPDLLPNLFERFVRADRSRSNGSGNGLGLAIVSSIVKAHHGSVTAESTEGRTVFRVRLPLIGESVSDGA
jgi:signal transduction histidine kinase